MSEKLKYGLGAIGVGILSLFIGLKGKKPTWVGDKLRTYALIVVGSFLVVAGILFLFGIITDNS